MVIVHLGPEAASPPCRFPNATTWRIDEKGYLHAHSPNGPVAVFAPGWTHVELVKDK